jgi:choline dehydrogenase-like flavoprotein
MDCDVCIVGAGAAGITLALQYLHGNQRVILLESGAMHANASTQHLYRAEIVPPPLHPPAEQYRVRRFGGSTTIWGGRCVPFDAQDFAPRPWVTPHGWPITYQALSRFYPQANEICEAGDFVYAASHAIPGGMRPMLHGFAPLHFSTEAIERFSCPTDFGRRYRHRLAASRQVTVLLNANCTGLHVDAAGISVTAVMVRTLAGVGFEINAATVILAAGGLENARLLLASNARHPLGLGNAGGQVGRNYMCHIAGTAGVLRLRGPAIQVDHGYQRAQDGVYCRRRLSLTPQVQKDFGLASSILRLHFPPVPDPSHRSGPLSAIYLARRFIRAEYAARLTGAAPPTWQTRLAHLANIARDPGGTAGCLLHWLRRRTLARRKFPSIIVPARNGIFSLDYHAEQQPNPLSRVTLGEDVDRLGMRRLRIDWRASALDAHTVRETFRLLAADLESWGGATLDYDADAVEQLILGAGAYGGHHIGTARMGNDPAHSVVDENCRVHGMRNLYVAGSAVFPTSSQANPTLTIVALALRLAEHLKERKNVLF